MAKQTILLVDDENNLLSLWTLRLESAGYSVVTAESGEEAMAILSASAPALVITDLRMGGIDGITLYEAIRKVNRSIPVIIITAYGSIEEAVEATKKGVYSFLTKPIDGRLLLHEIEKALVHTGQGSSETETGEWRKAIISQSTAMEELLDKVQRVASTTSNILIRGESGTGKEMLAVALHKASDRGEIV